jgi:hypothetical protein
MNMKIVIAGVGLLVACGVGLAAGPATNPAVSEGTLKLVKEAQAVARQNNPGDTAAAYARVFAAPDLPADQRLAAHMDIARVFSAKGSTAEAAAAYDKALAVDGLTPAQTVKVLNASARMWFQSNFAGAWASYATDGLDKAADLYRQVIKLPGASNEDRIAAYAALANCHLECMNTNGAHAALDDALKLPDLKDAERFAAVKNKADTLYRELEFGRALPLYESLWSTNLQANLRGAIERRIVDITRRVKGEEEALKLVTGKFQWGPMGLADYFGAGKQDEAVRLYDGVLADAKADYRTRFDALEKLMGLFAGTPDFDAFKANAERRIDLLVAAEPKASEIYARLGSHQFAQRPVGKDPRFIRWRLEKVIANASSSKDKVAAKGALFDAFMKQRDFDQAMVTAKALLADTNTPFALRQSGSLALIVSGTKGAASSVLAKVNAALDQDAAIKTSQVARAEALLKTAQLAMNMRYEAVARTLYAAREKMLVRGERPSIACTFLEKGPQDITGFMNAAYFKDRKNRGVLDRKYGENVQFLLETDAALTGRKVTEKEASFVPTEFVAACDEDGIRIFFYATTAKAKDFADGLVGLGGYEAYLAAGPDAPYHCYLIDMPPGGMSDDFVTQYNNKTFRRARQKEDTAKIEHQVFDNGVATLLTVSWAAFFNVLPKTGDAWDFEPLHWEQGGYSWGGSESVHNRSSFGSLVFANMTPANVNAIKRRLLSKAVSAYRQELSSQNGFVEIWQDPELGDRTFYLKAVKPLTDKLNAYLAKVKPGMSAEEVDLVFAEAVPSWMNIQYIVADMRRDYLEAQRTAGL